MLISILVRLSSHFGDILTCSALNHRIWYIIVSSTVSDTAGLPFSCRHRHRLISSLVGSDAATAASSTPMNLASEVCNTHAAAWHDSPPLTGLAAAVSAAGPLFFQRPPGSPAHHVGHYGE